MLTRYLKLKALYTRVLNIAIRRDFGSWGVGVQIHPPFCIEGAERIHLGMATSLASGCWLIAHPGGEIRTGERFFCAGDLSLSAAARITIGNDVLFSRNVHVVDHLHAHADPSQPIHAQGLARVAAVTIDDGAWLGPNVVVLPGVTIGRNAVIGANSVVTRDVPAFATAVGAPARVVQRQGR
jgi:acetyltransferase-like isoleucine patch superfamily enzyme